MSACSGYCTENRKNTHDKILGKLFGKQPKIGFYVKIGAKNAKKFIKGVAFCFSLCYNTFDFF